MTKSWQNALLVTPLLCACDWQLSLPTVADSGWFESPGGDAGVEQLLEDYGIDTTALQDAGTLDTNALSELGSQTQPGTDSAPFEAVSPDAPTDVTLSGTVEKGPLLGGSKVSGSVLDEQLVATASAFETRTLGNRGEFEVTFRASGPVALQGQGFYYNEVLGRRSGSEVTLRALYLPTAAPQLHANINVVTHLTTDRIRQLVAEGSPFPDAVVRAEADLLRELAITTPNYAPQTAGIAMSVGGADTEDNAYLLGVSSVAIEVALTRDLPLDEAVQGVLDSYAADLADGTLQQEHRAEVRAAVGAVSVDRVQADLAGQLGSPIPNMHRVLDQDGDGVVNAEDASPLGTTAVGPAP